jgi:hypothetical protein
MYTTGPPLLPRLCSTDSDSDQGCNVYAVTVPGLKKQCQRNAATCQSVDKVVPSRAARRSSFDVKAASWMFCVLG